MGIINKLLERAGLSGARGRLWGLGDFDKDTYLRLNPDVLEAGVNPVAHYIKHGRAEGRPCRFPAFEHTQSKAFDPKRQTALLVTHESSLTGAPVLVYNMAELLSRTMNVVVLSLGGGTLEAMFKELDIAYIPAHYARFSAPHAEYVVDRLVEHFHVDLAIVNSVESRLVVEPLKRAGIPSVTLIHEFASCYPEPQIQFKAMMTASEQIVFSSEITFSDAARYVPNYPQERLHILPQGRSRIPGTRTDDESAQRERQKLRSILRPEGERPRKYVVLGAGSVNYRKGIDLFLQCATQILSKVGEDRCRFVWIGQGYQPRKDAAYSVYLEDQILRAGLTDAVQIIDETTEIETAYALSDLFLLSSRLDPLPNVAIDAMFFNKPLVCFDKTTGVVSFLESVGLKEVCVADYLNVEQLADKASRLLLSPDLQSQVLSKLEGRVADAFDMARYVEQIVALVKRV